MFCALVMVLAWVSYREYAQTHQTEAEGRLAAIADAKANEVAGWRRERLADGQFFAGNRAVIDLARRVFSPRGDANAEAALRDLLERMQRNHPYSRIALFDATGTERVVSSTGGGADDGHMRRTLQEAATAGGEAFMAVHASERELPHLVIVAPVLPGLGAVMIWIDAGPALTEVVHGWPTDTETGRTQIVMRSGDDALLLNGLLDPTEVDVFPRVPMSRTDLPTVQAILNGKGVASAVDDLGIPVVAASVPIRGSAWHLVVTQSEDEVFAPLRTRAVLIATIALLLIAAAAGALAVVWRGQSRQIADDERRLLDSLKSMAEVVEASPVVLFQWKAVETWPVEWVSANVARWGYAPARLMANDPPFSSLLHPDDRERVNEEVLRFSQSGAESFVQEYRIVAADGRVIWVDDRTTVVRNAQSVVVQFKGTLTDITERKHLQAQFVQAQKMETVGRLAGGVAHDFNNLLTVINGYAEFALSGMSPDDPHREMVQEIRDAGQRAESLTRQLLTFSRREVVQATSVDLNVIADQMRKMLERLIGEDVRLTFDLDPGLWRVKADAGQIEQVIMNLAVNARDAMPDGGTLLVTTRNVEGESDTVLLAVADTGCGMDAATQERLFEPFFTTKKVGQGTGLGLATVYGIVTQAGGRIEVSSAVGQGSTFSVYLPRLTGDATPERPVGITDGLVRGTERILLVEDEAALQRIAVRILEAAGYRTACASNGADAMAICARDPEPFDLLLTDVVMPGMSGHELASRLATTRPDMKVLFASGYLHDAFPERTRLGPDVHFLAKPYTPTSLTAKVRAVLDRT